MTRLTPEQINFRRTARFIEYVAELEINDLQKQTLLDVYQLIKHGSKFINLHIRKDGREYHFEADWLKQLFHSLSHTESDGWQTMETAPRDENVLLATSGGWVGEARFELMHDQTWDWIWASGSIVHEQHKKLGWRPLPAPPETKE